MFIRVNGFIVRYEQYLEKRGILAREFFDECLDRDIDVYIFEVDFKEFAAVDLVGGILVAGQCEYKDNHSDHFNKVSKIVDHLLFSFFFFDDNIVERIFGALDAEC